MAKEIKKDEAQVVALSKTEQFLTTYKTAILSVVAVALLLVAGALVYSKFIYAPAKEEALGETYKCEALFQAGQFEAALKGDDTCIGFEEVIAQYGSKAGKAVYLYAGICDLQLGEWEAAIANLKKYNGTDPILKARAIACIGHAYVGLENLETAVKCFEKAAATADNMYAAAYLLQAGIIYEELGNNAAALKAYKTIKDEYPYSYEGMDIDKYISRVESK